MTIRDAAPGQLVIVDNRPRAARADRLCREQPAASPWLPADRDGLRSTLTVLARRLAPPPAAA
jgi:hypothetical protein